MANIVKKILLKIFILTFSWSFFSAFELFAENPIITILQTIEKSAPQRIDNSGVKKIEKRKRSKSI